MIDNATCTVVVKDKMLEHYYNQSAAIAACDARGPNWQLPTIAMANALLSSMTPDEKNEWFPLSGNGGGGYPCQQTQTGLNAVWWLMDTGFGPGPAAGNTGPGSWPFHRTGARGRRSPPPRGPPTWPASCRLTVRVAWEAPPALSD